MKWDYAKRSTITLPMPFSACAMRFVCMCIMVGRESFVWTQMFALAANAHAHTITYTRVSERLRLSLYVCIGWSLLSHLRTNCVFTAMFVQVFVPCSSQPLRWLLGVCLCVCVWFRRQWMTSIPFEMAIIWSAFFSFIKQWLFYYGKGIQIISALNWIFPNIIRNLRWNLIFAHSFVIRYTNWVKWSNPLRK